MRADARRNYDRIVVTARDAFAEHGIDIPLDDIAKRAHVGAGTLYRHFPSREALVEAVYRNEVTQLADRAYALRDELAPEEALFVWIREEVRWVTESSGLASTLKAAIEDSSRTFSYCKEELRAAVSSLLAPAQAAGVVRADLEPSDVLRLSHGVGAAATYADAEGAERLLSVVLDGIRA
ncbi:helix-turn-helix domain-containing protein [Actinophytocola sp.]|jgi:AcrR family transcriptional regulator|uniref:TetR/AcrR family transcriptional regulator n=1 Tax=Actinophytocola sp. TaxID=1872138 RepID=UPI002ED7F67E